MQEQKKQTLHYLEEIKENCPQMRNIQYLGKSNLNSQINYLAGQVAVEKRTSIMKLCEQQEQKIYASLKRVKRFSLINEIKNVNPGLHQELKEIKTTDLAHKLGIVSSKYEEHYQQLQKKLQSQVTTEDSYSCESTHYPKHMEQEEDDNVMQTYGFLESSVKQKKQYIVMRNLMDEYENNKLDITNDYSDLYINKYFDLN